jgi:hypothetical protein
MNFPADLTLAKGDVITPEVMAVGKIMVDNDIVYDIIFFVGAVL